MVTIYIFTILLLIIAPYVSCVKTSVLVRQSRKTLANDQLDAEFPYFIIRLLQSSTCFEQRRAHHQEVKFY